MLSRYERRSFGRDFDRDRDKDRHRDRAERNRYADRRRAYSDSREEEPEWFSSKCGTCFAIHWLAN